MNRVAKHSEVALSKAMFFCGKHSQFFWVTYSLWAAGWTHLKFHTSWTPFSLTLRTEISLYLSVPGHPRVYWENSWGPLSTFLRIFQVISREL